MKEKETKREPRQTLAPLLPEDYAFNLSDFALFLSVMKNREAYECTLSIILGEEDLKLTQVKVEQVVLNRSGKRAIRLDAWAMDSKNRQINTEMQNDTAGDDVRKRARYYQGLMDSPVLKSGRETRYKQLPSTVIIFITKEDIFGRDLAKYTFTEQCEEVAGLHLEDGTKKIFVNMSSRQGSPELVSLLQYMRETRMDNPAITVQDERIKRLDSIVNEVRQSEEWEAVKMNILQIGEEHGKKIGQEIGKEIGKEIGRDMKLIEQVCRKLQKNKTPNQIAEELEEDEETVLAICRAAESSAPAYDCETIYREWKGENGKDK